MAINFDDAFTKNYMDSMYPQPPEEPTQDVLLASGPVRSDVVGEVTVQGYNPSQDTAGGAFVGSRLKTPKAGQPQPTTQDRQRLGIQLFDALAAMPKGAVQATVGLPGDLESIGRTVLDYFGYNVNQETALPTSEDISKRLESVFGPVVPKGQTTIVPTAEREQAAKSGETVGEFLPAPGIPEAVVRGGRLIRRGIQATKNMPVGMSTQIVGEGVSELGFYSAAKQAVDSIQQPKGTGEQFLKQIEKTPGVKPEEIKWTGLDDFLKSKKSVTKAEVQEFLDKNRVEIKEVRLGEQETYDPARLKQLEEEYANLKQHPIDDPSFGEAKYDEMIRLMNIRDKSTTDSLYAQVEASQRTAQRMQQLGLRDEAEKYFRQAELFNTRAEKLDLEGLGMEAPTKFSKYTLPGGENYREILLTLPAKQTSPSKIEFKNTEDVDNFLTDMSIGGYENLDYGRLNDGNVVEFGGAIPSNVMQIIRNNDGEIIAGKSTAGSTYGSPHFDQPNILAHMRVNDRVDADGKKVLFIEEVQSDWHQAGRKKGYQGSMPLDQAKQKLLNEGYTPEALANTSDADIIKTATEYGVPDAPFKTTWHELAMKRAIQLAAEGGYDRVAFTTGKTQAERYDLSKEISRITYTEAGVLRAYDKSDNMVLSKKLESPDQIEDYIGKEPAKKLLEKEVGKVNVDKKYTGPGMEFDGRELSGVDLQIGGEGMKGFYDQILPKFLDKYAKKWDAKTGMTKIQTESKAQAMADADLLEGLGTPRDKIDTSGMVSVQYIDVTPKMKESVLTKGQPLFAIGAGGAAVQQEENQ